MKQIGYIKDNAWEAAPPWAPLSAALYIPNPGERENINAETYEQIGWVNPTDADRMGGGKLYETHSHAGPDSRPAYIVRVQPAEQSPHPLSESTLVGRSEFDEYMGRMDQLVDRILDRIHALEHAAQPTPTEHAGEPAPGPLSQMPTYHLIQTALTFCTGELDGVDYPDATSRRNQFARCTVLIRELVSRLTRNRANRT